jgi:hypothetical protein
MFPGSVNSVGSERDGGSAIAAAACVRVVLRRGASRLLVEASDESGAQLRASASAAENAALVAAVWPRLAMAMTSNMPLGST